MTKEKIETVFESKYDRKILYKLRIQKQNVRRKTCRCM